MKARIAAAVINRSLVEGPPEKTFRWETVDEYMDDQFGRGRWVFDDNCTAWITVDQSYSGPGIRYIAVRRDLSSTELVKLPSELH